MARIKNPQDHQKKRDEILEAAQRFIMTQGYEQMSIQNILDDLGISKGAFYYYFDSKQALLEGLIERMMAEADKLLAPVAADPDLPALAKMERFFGSVARWKYARKAYLEQIMRVWYADHNAIVRHKLTSMGIEWMSPFMRDIIQQGIREGLLDASLNQESARVVISMMTSMGESIATAMLALSSQADEEARLACLGRVENTVQAYQDAIERVLGAPAGSIVLFDYQVLRDWILEPSQSLPNAATAAT